MNLKTIMAGLCLFGLWAGNFPANNPRTMNMIQKTIDVPHGYEHIELRGSLMLNAGPTAIEAGVSDDAIYVQFNQNFGNVTVNSFLLSGHDTLSWHPRRIDNSCDDPSIYGGGARIMQSWLLNSQEQLACPNGGRVYFTDETDWEKFGYTTYNPTNGSFDIFGVFTYRIDTVCISHDEMEYYYTNILNYYNQETSTILPTRAIMRTYVDTAVIPYSQPNLNGYPGDLWYWRIFIHYGKPNCTNSDPIK